MKSASATLARQQLALPRENAEDRCYRGVGRDITGKKQAEERIQYLAHHDGLTTLPNRVMFGEMLSNAIRQGDRYGRKFALLFIDLDRFKIINDTLGHDAGDQLLKEIGARLRHTLRASDIVARLGGDEFVVLAPEIDEPAQAEAVAREALARPVTILGQECRVTASIGIALYPADGRTEEMLMTLAEETGLIDVLGETGLKPELLELELTESMAMQNIERTTRILAALKAMGVRIAIDDFGVGYSSLADLQRFPIETLKPDRSFIRDLASNNEDRTITEAIITMGRMLSMTVVAEGVETRERQAFLLNHACDEMQGFYFSKPIGAGEFAEFLVQHEATIRP